MQFTAADFDVRAWLADGGIVFDVKSALPADLVDGRLSRGARRAARASR
ncbi:MAG: hypothetical protein KDC23_08460 [Actinobacteria bacterium]|nr:hypothetical protein [Actinomycetota bacterium]